MKAKAGETAEAQRVLAAEAVLDYSVYRGEDAQVSVDGAD
jgi:hypothetical protein